jgi:hypothetical protein
MDNNDHSSNKLPLIIGAVILAASSFALGHWWAATSLKTPLSPETSNLATTSAITRPVVEPLTPNIPASPQPTTKQSQVLITQLKQRLETVTAQLDQSRVAQAKLKDENQQFNDLYLQHRSELNPTYNDSVASSGDEALADNKVLTPEQVEQLLPPPFDRFYRPESPSMVKKFNQFVQQPRDEHWALLMENNIRDFITMHELAGEITLDAVNCKTSGCEVRGFERQDKAWSIVYGQLKMQDWWKFTSTSSSSQSNDEHSIFYLMAVNR